MLVEYGPHAMVLVRALSPHRGANRDLYRCSFCHRHAVWVHGLLTYREPNYTLTAEPDWMQAKEPCPKNPLLSGLDRMEVHVAYAEGML